jgi:hypothetical protein
MIPIRTNVGLAAHGDNYFRGYSVRDELIGRVRFWGLASLAVGGAPSSDEQCAFLDELATAMLAPDPRLWPVKVAWLAGAYGSTAAAWSASQSYMNHALCGPSIGLTAAETWQELAQEAGRARQDPSGAIARWLAARHESLPSLLGVGAPGRDEDERMVLVKRAAERHGRTEGRFFRLLVQVDAIVRASSDLRLNVVTAVSACLLDLGYTPRQVSHLCRLMMSLSLLANAVEAAEAGEPLRDLNSDSVCYVGPAPRSSPRARAASHASHRDFFVPELERPEAESFHRETLGLDVASLAHRLRQHLHTVMRRDFRVSVFCNRDAPRVIEADPLVFDRVTADLARFAARSINRGSIVVEIGGTPGWVTVTVSVGGSGFDAKRIDAIECHDHLSTVDRLVEGLGGRLEVVSSGQRGATLRVHLPDCLPARGGAREFAAGVAIADALDPP